MPTSVRDSGRLSRRLLLGCLLMAACSDATSPGPAPAVKLGFSTEPTTATAGVGISPLVTVAIQDASGNIVTNATSEVTLTIAANASGATLAGTTTVAAENGVATFHDLRILRAGTGYTLKAEATRLTAATSSSFAILVGPATQLLFTAQPSNAMGGATITPPVEVVAQDSVGNLAPAFGELVTVALGGNVGPGTLSGTTVVRAVNGVATLRDLSIAQVGGGYTLTASAGTLPVATSATFSISKPTATLRITAVTSGSLPDPDGYSACIDPTLDGHGGITCAYDTPLTVGVFGSGTVTVDTGAHTVQLMGVAAACAVVGDNPEAVFAARAEETAVPFAIRCGPGALHITTTTTGLSLDPDGYSVCLDPDWSEGCAYDSAIGVNGGVTVPVELGTHQVELAGVAPNCTVSGDNPRTVEAGAATEVPFVIMCAGFGTVHVTTTTTGIDLPSSYVVSCVESLGNPCARVSVPANGTVAIPGVIPGPHTVALTSVAENCSVSGSTTRAVIVPPNGTVEVAFDVGCIVAERIAFSSGEVIVVIHADGTGRQEITPGLAPAWSPDGTRLAYECGQDICAINADGAEFARLTVDAAGNHHPTWSPDGLKIAFAATHVGVTDLYVMSANGTGATRLTQAVGFVGSPAWSPDGTQIAFDCRVDVGNDDICSVNAGGSGFARLTNDPARDYGAAWKPNGAILAFATTRSGEDEIVLMSPAGGSVTRIGAGLSGFAPAWSLDGSRLAFVEDCSDGWCAPHEIYVATADGANVRPLGGGDQPAWKPHL